MAWASRLTLFVWWPLGTGRTLFMLLLPLRKHAWVKWHLPFLLAAEFTKEGFRKAACTPPPVPRKSGSAEIKHMVGGSAGSSVQVACETRFSKEPADCRLSWSGSAGPVMRTCITESVHWSPWAPPEGVVRLLGGWEGVLWLGGLPGRAASKTFRPMSGARMPRNITTAMPSCSTKVARA